MGVGVACMPRGLAPLPSAFDPQQGTLDKKAAAVKDQVAVFIHVLEEFPLHSQWSGDELDESPEKPNP